MASDDLADAVAQMRARGRYRRLLFIADTCQAATLHGRMVSPGVLAIGSSRLKENSYSWDGDPLAGVSVIDRFTSSTLDFFEQHEGEVVAGNATVQDLFDSYDPHQLMSHADPRLDLFPEPLSQAREPGAPPPALAGPFFGSGVFRLAGFEFR